MLKHPLTHLPPDFLWPEKKSRCCFKSLIARFPVAYCLMESIGILYKCRVSGVPEPAHGLVRQLCPSLSNSAVSDFKLVVLNYLWWDYLHYGTRPRIHIRTPSMPPRKPVKHLSAAYYWVIYITLTNNNTYYATFVKKLPTVQETEAMATHSSILAWRIPADRRAWQAAVHGVAKSRTRLSNSAQHTTHYLPS